MPNKTDLEIERINRAYFERLAVIDTPEMKKGQANGTYIELCRLYDKIRNLARDALIGESAKRNITRLLEKAGRQGLIPVKKGLPTSEGVYLARGIWGDQVKEIDVYEHPIKGLCCYADNFGSSGTEGVDDSTDCHVSVQMTGLEFIVKVGELNQDAMDREIQA